MILIADNLQVINTAISEAVDGRQAGPARRRQAQNPGL
jgi:hypothetical protein